MKKGFSFELYETLFEDCFINRSRYKNGNLQLSLFGFDFAVNDIAHFADITLNQDERKLNENEIIVDCKFKPTLIPQLKELGIIKEQVGTFVKNNMFYPIYTLDQTNVKQKEYCMQQLVAA